MKTAGMDQARGTKLRISGFEDEMDEEGSTGDFLSGTAARRVRADGRNNRQRLLAAANAVFGTEGIRAALEPIARRAGLGRATLARHFPNRAALLAALHDELLTSIERHAASLGPEGDALFRLLAYYVDEIARRGTLVDHWVSLDLESGPRQRARERVRAVMQPLLERAIATGHCRDDLAPADLWVVLYMLTPGNVGISVEGRHALARRALALVQEGLRPRTF